MPEFRLIQISDTHLARRLPTLTQNFHRVSEYIDARRPDLVVNSGDLVFDGPTSRDDLEFARELHAALPVACRYLPGNHESATTRRSLVRLRLNWPRSRSGRIFSRSSVKTAGASMPPVGVSSGSIRW